MINQSEVKKLINYNKDTGVITWSNPNFYCRNKKSGDIAGNSVAGGGYFKISLNGNTYSTHRIIWLYMTGSFPKEQIDHINGIKTDNRWVNLRECSPSENQQNRKINKNNTTGHAGVCFNKRIGKYIARIKCNNIYINLGYFLTISEAVECRLNAKKNNHKFNPIQRVL